MYYYMKRRQTVVMHSYQRDSTTGRRDMKALYSMKSHPFTYREVLLLRELINSYPVGPLSEVSSQGRQEWSITKTWH